MLEFFQTYGADIVAMIIALTGLITAITNLRKVAKIDRQAKQNHENTKEEIQITREGIVEAFKSAKIPTEWKVDVSNKIDDKLNKWRDELITMLQTKQDLTNDMLCMIVKILKFTAASAKLTDDDKAKLEELADKISEEDKTIKL